MPTLSAASLAAIVLALLAGMVTGWVLRAKRGKAEKVAINEGWHAQMEATRREHGRLAEQNKSLMEQVSQLQSSSRDAGNRARELSTALKEALARRDELQREIRVIRGNLENVVSQKHRLNDDLSQVRASEASHNAALAERDRRIAKLESELRNWQDRLPPLVERFRERNAEADRLAAELAAAEERLRGLEDMLGSDQTRVEPLAVDGELERYIASNEQLHPVDDEDADEPAEAEYDEDDAAETDDSDDDAVNGVEYGGGLRDNLREIKGIGPAIEKTLNELGIFRYAQVAQMTRYDIERIANRLKGFQSRIEREDWIGQARELAEARVEAANEDSRSIDGRAS
jgi:predicted flap endonuclease-1-like 5' DNA nuclease